MVEVPQGHEGTANVRQVVAGRSTNLDLERPEPGTGSQPAHTNVRLERRLRADPGRVAVKAVSGSRDVDRALLR